MLIFETLFSQTGFDMKTEKLIQYHIQFKTEKMKNPTYQYNDTKIMEILEEKPYHKILIVHDYKNYLQ